MTNLKKHIAHQIKAQDEALVLADVLEQFTNSNYSKIFIHSTLFLAKQAYFQQPKHVDYKKMRSQNTFREV